MNQVEFFLWLEQAPGGLWAFAFFCFVSSVFSIGYFVYRQVNKLIASSASLSAAVNNSSEQLNKKLGVLEQELKTILSQHDVEINNAVRQIGELKADLGYLKGQVVSLEMLKRIELFLEQLTAKGINPSSAILDALRFERTSREAGAEIDERLDRRKKVT